MTYLAPSFNWVWVYYYLKRAPDMSCLLYLCSNEKKTTKTVFEGCWNRTFEWIHRFVDGENNNSGTWYPTKFHATIKSDDYPARSKNSSAMNYNVIYINKFSKVYTSWYSMISCRMVLSYYLIKSRVKSLVLPEENRQQVLVVTVGITSV